MAVVITDSAAREISNIMTQQELDREKTHLRVGVKGGGCSGFKYDFTFDSKIDENDLMQQNIVVDKSSLDMLKGSQVDFSEELIGNSFKITNPKTKSSCGCGISFSF